MKKIEIDDETYIYLGTQTIPFEETPGDTVKRLLGLSDKKSTLVFPNFEVNKNGSNRTINALLATNNLLQEQGRTKKRKTSLTELIREGLLKNGQTLTLRDYKGNDYPEYHVVISNGLLIWENRAYSMSDLAQKLLKKHGYKADSVRGPYFWKVDGGKSIFELWNEYLQG